MRSPHPHLIPMHGSGAPRSTPPGYRWPPDAPRFVRQKNRTFPSCSFWACFADGSALLLAPQLATTFTLSHHTPTKLRSQIFTSRHMPVSACLRIPIRLLTIFTWSQSSSNDLQLRIGIDQGG
ncbi:hypothetical protein ARMSODRAFT_309874 [Armillaria solidipes]|uniref:Uncharacterized protein n=1 Tax=Armillaria solidipes TaxID=1076256 RepID=A0A2H3BN42_9AGAR|nr:hypothetical protein ARMSODRAFT_309874 [Armillaria solidipes]